nr:hypothetical protein [uncultured Duganella sp.]
MAHPIGIDFHWDWLAYIRHEMKSTGHDPDAIKTEKELIYGFLNLRDRTISAIPRKVLRAGTFICPPESAGSATLIHAWQHESALRPWRRASLTHTCFVKHRNPALYPTRSPADSRWWPRASPARAGKEHIPAASTNAPKFTGQAESLTKISGTWSDATGVSGTWVFTRDN